MVYQLPAQFVRLKFSLHWLVKHPHVDCKKHQVRVGQDIDAVLTRTMMFIDEFPTYVLYS
jgi:hypothetical protein